MGKKEWIETKRECEVDEMGNLKPLKTTLELEKKDTGWWGKNKDKLDFIIKGVGLISISVPFLLFYYQQKEENRRQKAIRQIEVYSNTSTILHTLAGIANSKSKTDSLKFKFFYESYPKIKFLGDTSIINQVDKLKTELDKYLGFSQIASQLDDFKDSLGVNLYPDVGSYYGTAIDHPEDTSKLNKQCQSLDRDLVSDEGNFQLIRQEINIYENKFNINENDTSKFLAKRVAQLNTISQQIDKLLSDLQEISSVVLSRLKQKKSLRIGISYSEFEFKLNVNTLLNDFAKLSDLRTAYSSYIDSKIDKLDSNFIKANALYE
jgi:hypothetical protein